MPVTGELSVELDYLIKSCIYGHFCVETVSKLGVHKRREILASFNECLLREGICVLVAEFYLFFRLQVSRYYRFRRMNGNSKLIPRSRNAYLTVYD